MIENIIIILSILYLIENKAIFNLIYFILIIILLTYLIFNIGITENIYNKEHEYMSIIILIIYISALAILFGIVILVTKTQKNYVSLIWNLKISSKSYFFNFFKLIFFFFIIFFLFYSSTPLISPSFIFPSVKYLHLQNLDYICNLGKILMGNYNIIFIFIFLMILLFVSIIVVINILL